MTQQTEKSKKVEPLRPMDVGLCDAHMFKAKVAHPIHGKPFRPIIYSVVDMATRVLVGWSVGLDSGSSNLVGALRHAAERSIVCGWEIGGVFAVIYTDPGMREMVTKSTAGCIPILTRIGTTHKVATREEIGGNGLLERFHRQVWVRVAEELGQKAHEETYSLDCRNMLFKESRTVDGDLLPTWEQFLRVCEEAFEEYNLMSNEALPVGDNALHLSPLDLWSQHEAEGWDMEACQVDGEDLDLLFMPSVSCGVQRGIITLVNRRYHSAKLELFEGKVVEVACCPENPGTVWIWDETNSLVCTAELEQGEDYLFPTSAVTDAREKRAKRRDEIKRQQLQEIEVERLNVRQSEGSI